MYDIRPILHLGGDSAGRLDFLAHPHVPTIRFCGKGSCGVPNWARVDVCSLFFGKCLICYGQALAMAEENEEEDVLLEGDPREEWEASCRPRVLLAWPCFVHRIRRSQVFGCHTLQGVYYLVERLRESEHAPSAN